VVQRTSVEVTGLGHPYSPLRILTVLPRAYPHGPSGALFSSPTKFLGPFHRDSSLLSKEFSGDAFFPLRFLLMVPFHCCLLLLSLVVPVSSAPAIAILHGYIAWLYQGIVVIIWDQQRVKGKVTTKYFSPNA
jgi:hypothetical protein